jgi:hypothetical protein
VVQVAKKFATMQFLLRHSSRKFAKFFKGELLQILHGAILLHFVLLLAYWGAIGLVSSHLRLSHSLILLVGTACRCVIEI